MSTRITIVPAELFDAFRNGLVGPMRHPGKSAHGARRGRRRGGRRTGRGSAAAAAALGDLRWSRRWELVFGPRERLLCRTRFSSIVPGGRPRKHSRICRRKP